MSENLIKDVKGKKRMIFDNDRKLLLPQYHSILYRNPILIYNIGIANKVSC